MKVNFLLNHTDREIKELFKKILSLLEEFGIFVSDVIEISCEEKGETCFVFYANKVKTDKYLPSPNGSYENQLNQVIVDIFNFCDDSFIHCYQEYEQIMISTQIMSENEIKKTLDIIYLGLIGTYNFYENGCPFKLDKEELRKIFKEGV